MSLPLAQAVERLEGCLKRLGYRIVASREGEKALLEALRYPWLSLGWPLLHIGVILACVGGLVGGRLDWQDGPVVLVPAQSYGLRHVAGTALYLQRLGFLSGSSQPYTWLSLRRGGEAWCEGTASPGQELSCTGVSVRQGGPEPALRIIGYDRAGQPLSLQLVRGEEISSSDVILPLPWYAARRVVAIPERGVWLQIEVSPDRPTPVFHVEALRFDGGQPSLREDIIASASLTLNDLSLTLTPSWLPSFTIYHRPVRSVQWAGWILALVGLLLGLAHSFVHLWAEVESTVGGVRLRLCQGLPVPWRLPVIKKTESELRRLSEAGGVS